MSSLPGVPSSATARRRARACCEARVRARVRFVPPALLPTSHDVAARGARIRFVEAGSGAPLILLHDYLASRVVWDDVLPGLAQRFRVIAPDLPGFGESEKPPPGRYRYDFDAFAESLVDLIAAVVLVRARLCAHP